MKTVTREFGTYLVTGKRDYRGHAPGTMFDARLDRNAEARACRRGDIRLIDRFVPEVRPGSYRFPDGWTDPPPATGDITTTETRRQAGFSLEGETR